MTLWAVPSWRPEEGPPGRSASRLGQKSGDGWVSRILLSSLYRSLLLLLLFVFCGGCLSYTDKHRPVRHAVQSGNLPRAFELLKEADYLGPEGKNRLLFFLERATIYHHLRDYESAERDYLRAAQVMKELYTISLSRTALTFVVNESTSEYAGEPYEMIAVHLMLASLYLQMNQLNKARVEAKRINTKLRELRRRDSEGDHGGYHRDAFALYLSGAIFEALGEFDSAAIDYQAAYETYKAGYPGAGGPPDSLIRGLFVASRAAGRSGSVRVLQKRYPRLLTAESSLGEDKSGIWFLALGYPVVAKVSRDFVFPLNNTVVRYSWPSIPAYSPSLPSYDLQVRGSEKDRRAQAGASSQNISRRVDLELGQDIDEIARWSLEDRRLALGAKTIARLASKEVLNQQLMEINPLLGIFSNIIGSFLETADTRSWSLLPGKFAAVRVSLPPGKYQYTYLVRNRYRVSSTVRVKSGELKLAVLDYTHGSSSSELDESTPNPSVALAIGLDTSASEAETSLSALTPLIKSLAASVPTAGSTAMHINQWGEERAKERTGDEVHHDLELPLEPHYR